MNKVVMFLMGIVILVVISAAMFFTGAIFDASNKQSVRTYFFQGNNFSYQRPGLPLSPKQLGESQLFNLLVQKYVTEYFYVLPELADIERRESNVGPLNTMSNNAATFNKWKETVAPEIREMAQAGMLRTVSVSTPLKYGDFYQVEFELTTWQYPNDMDEMPTISSGVMQFKVAKRLSMTESSLAETNVEMLKQLHARIKEGYDPVGVFNFRVSDVIVRME